MVEATEDSLDIRLQALLCSKTSVTDFGTQGGKIIGWVSAQKNPAALCRKLGDLKKSGVDFGKISLGDLRAYGGFFAHLEVKTLASGLFAAIVHDQEHRLLSEYQGIFQCHGMRGDEPYMTYPDSLQGLKFSEFDLRLSVQNIVGDDGHWCRYVTQGVKTLSIPDSTAKFPADATLAYTMVRTVMPVRGTLYAKEFSSSLVEATATIKEARQTISVAFTLFSANRYMISYETASSFNRFEFDNQGNLVALTASSKSKGSEPMQVESQQWSSAFKSCFNTARSPAIDPFSVVKMLGVFTNHGLQIPGEPSVGREASVLDRLVAYR